MQQTSPPKYALAENTANKATLLMRNEQKTGIIFYNHFAHEISSQTVREMFCLQFGSIPVPPHPSDRDSVFQQPPGSRAGGAEIRELHCQAGMIYLTNISIQPRTRISNEARQS